MVVFVFSLLRKDNRNIGKRQPFGTIFSKQIINNSTTKL